MIHNWVPSLSTYSADIDFVIALIAVIVGFWFFLTQGVFFWLLWRFRYQEGVKAQYVTGKEPHLKRWIHWPHNLIILCDIAIIYYAATTWYNVKQAQPEAERKIGVVAQQWAWTFVQPGADGELGTEDDIKTVETLNIEEGVLYHFELESRDVMHDFSIPVFRLKQDAIPGRVIRGWFEATDTGTHDIQCAEMCGIGHGIMAAKVVIRDSDGHAAWIAENSK